MIDSKEGPLTVEGPRGVNWELSRICLFFIGKIGFGSLGLEMKIRKLEMGKGFAQKLAGNWHLSKFGLEMGYIPLFPLRTRNIQMASNSCLRLTINLMYQFIFRHL